MTGSLPGSRRARAATTWGLVGALAFLVLHQGYLLAGGTFLGLAPVGGIALLVGATTTLAAYLFEGRVVAPNEQS
ncbi:hypothetical protein BRD00_04795 [Halobacteriales archaeon QS_8_69_26]|nr:MAG: hypothetical protein BRD00_04795 [Halobacteriales archaeon QS_8_69_26]